MNIAILGIESSCDDTSAAVLLDGKIQTNITATQKIHEKYGGVVPEMASRVHQQNIVPVVDQAIKQAGISKHDLSAIAFTRGPGLIGSLMVGSSFAKAMSFTLEIPLIEVNHMQAHVLSHFIEEPKPEFPFLCLTVSGGHTQIVLVNDYLNMEIIGETLDDAAGEAFDKTAKMLGLTYPGGPLVDKLARGGDKTAFHFPRPDVPGYNYSFSGLKTAVLYFIRDHLQENSNFLKENMENICASVQHTIVEILLYKLKKAAADTSISRIAIAGGVSANSGLRDTLSLEANNLGWRTYIPKLEYCTDNAAMIGMLGYYKYLKHDFAGQDIAPLARMKF